MKPTRTISTLLLVPVVLAGAVLMGADGGGCGGDVIVGSDECKVGGCGNELCGEPDEDLLSDCDLEPTSVCYETVGSCERDAQGACGWAQTQALLDCLDEVENPPDCVVGGCSGELCVEPDQDGGTCEWQEHYACYPDVGICERAADGTCGWRDTDELAACIDEKTRDVVTGACIKTNGDACAEDADCMSGGCGGELCFNPALSGGASDCECTAPPFSCGCVNGQCVWYE